MATARVAIFNDTLGDQRHLGCALVMDRLKAIIEAAGGEVVFRWPHDRDWRKAINELPERNQIDAIVVNGEGTMHGGPARENAVALAEIGAFATTHYGVPVALVNATLYDNDAAFYQLLKYFDLVWLRDKMSCKNAREHQVAAEYCPDLTLSQDWLDTNVIREGIGVTGSVRHRDDLSLRRFSRATGAEFVSMVEGKQPSAKSFMTLSVGKHRKAWRSRKRFSEINWDLQPQSPAALISWIAGRSLIVTGRYHTATLCVLTRTPFLFLESNTPKISALCEDVGLRSNRRINKVKAGTPAELATLIAVGDFDADEKAALSDFAVKSKCQFNDMKAALSMLFKNSQYAGERS